MKRIVIAAVLATISSSAYAQYWGPNLGAGPGSPYAVPQSYGGPSGDGPNVLYPVRSYIVRHTPVYVKPGPIIINNSNVNIDNRRVTVKPRVVRPRPRPVYIPEPVYTIDP